MTLTVKESGLLEDLKKQEELCIGKYGRYESEAVCPCLKQLFADMKATEQSHLETLGALAMGNIPSAPATLSGENNEHCGTFSYPSENERKADAFLCQDMLTGEKHAANLYNTAVFEFVNPAARKLLNHIQAEEQQHGEKIYAFMSANNMQ